MFKVKLKNDWENFKRGKASGERKGSGGNGGQGQARPRDSLSPEGGREINSREPLDFRISSINSLSNKASSAPTLRCLFPPANSRVGQMPKAAQRSG